MQRVNNKVKTLKTKRENDLKCNLFRNALTINLTYISRKSKPHDGLFKLTQNNFIQRANSLHWIQLWSHKALFTLLPDTWCSLKRCKTSELLTYDMNLIVTYTLHQFTHVRLTSHYINFSSQFHWVASSRRRYGYVCVNELEFYGFVCDGNRFRVKNKQWQKQVKMTSFSGKRSNLVLWLLNSLALSKNTPC